MSTAAKDSQPSGMRVSDADRDRALAELSEHFQAGRLTADEHEERMDLALKARTAGDLAALFTDLPRKPSTLAGSPSQPAVPAASSPPARFHPALVVPVVILAAVILGGIVSGHPFVIGLGPVILVLLIVRGLLGGGRHHHHDRHHHDHDRHHHDHDHDRHRHHDRDWDRDQRWDQDRRR
jgi:ABC-type nickel/cobalt efflux system permease component RcnA